MILGQDQYEVNVGTRKITIKNIDFKLTQEGLFYVLNVTQGKIYYVAAQSYIKASVDGNYIIYDSLETFPVLQAGDVMHIQLENLDSVNSGNLKSEKILENILAAINVTNFHLAIINNTCINKEDAKGCQ